MLTAAPSIPTLCQMSKDIAIRTTTGGNDKKHSPLFDLGVEKNPNDRQRVGCDMCVCRIFVRKNL